MALNTTNPASEVTVGPLMLHTTLATSTVAVSIASPVSGNLVRGYITVMDSTSTVARSWTMTVDGTAVSGSTMTVAAGTSTRGGFGSATCNPTRVNQGELIGLIYNGESTSTAHVINWTAVVRT